MVLSILEHELLSLFILLAQEDVRAKTRAGQACGTWSCASSIFCLDIQADGAVGLCTCCGRANSIEGAAIAGKRHAFDARASHLEDIVVKGMGGKLAGWCAVKGHEGAGGEVWAVEATVSSDGMGADNGGDHVILHSVEEATSVNSYGSSTERIM